MDLLELLGTTADGAFVSNGEHRIIFWNKQAEHILGYPSSEVMSRPCNEVMCGRDRSGNLVCQSNCMEIGAARRGDPIPTHDLLVRAADGRVIWLNVSNLFIPSTSEAKPPTIVHLFREVTVQRERELLVSQVLVSLRRLLSLEGEGANAVASAAALPRELTRREAEVLGLLCEGTSARGIAERLVISLPTARKHIQNVLDKLGVHSRLEALAYVSKHRLLDHPLLQRTVDVERQPNGAREREEELNEEESNAIGR